MSYKQQKRKLPAESWSKKEQKKTSAEKGHIPGVHNWWSNPTKNRKLYISMLANLFLINIRGQLHVATKSVRNSN